MSKNLTQFLASYVADFPEAEHLLREHEELLEAAKAAAGFIALRSRPGKADRLADRTMDTIQDALRRAHYGKTAQLGNTLTTSRSQLDSDIKVIQSLDLSFDHYCTALRAAIAKAEGGN